jgi:hypothetical protein
MMKRPQQQTKQNKRPVICVTDSEERDYGGHYVSHFCQYTRLLIQSGARVVAICPYPEMVRRMLSADGVTESDVLSIQEITAHPKIKMPVRKGFRKLCRRIGAIRRWKKLAEDVQFAERQLNLKIDHVFMANVPSFAFLYERVLVKIIDRVFRKPWSAWSYDSSFFRHSKGVYEDWILKKNYPGCLHSKYLHRIFHIDEQLVHEMNRIGGTVNKFCYVPDVTDTRLPESLPTWIRNIRDQASTKKIVLLPGVQGQRKGLYIALELAKKRSDLFFVFAGPLDPDDHPPGGLDRLRRLMTEPPGNCFFHMLRIESEKDFNALICAADAIWAVYSGHLTGSGIWVKSAFFKKPIVIADNAPLMCAWAEKYQFGIPVQADSLPECSIALDRLLAGEETPAVLPELLQDFSTDRLQQIMKSFVSVKI